MKPLFDYTMSLEGDFIRCARKAGVAVAFAATVFGSMAANATSAVDEDTSPTDDRIRTELMALCLSSPGNDEESCACGVAHAAGHLDREQLAILAFMAGEMRRLDADEDLFMAIIRRFRLSPERFHEAMSAINRVSAEASTICEGPPLRPVAQ